MAGPVYYSDEYDAYNKFPSYLDGRVIYYDWMRGFIYFLELDEQGNPTDWYSFMPNTEFNNVIDMEFGADGQLYMIEYGTGWFTRNQNARLSRINYVKGNRSPDLKVTLSKTRGAAPLEVAFDACASTDFDGDELKYKWLIAGETITDSAFQYTFPEPGVYYPELFLSDGQNTIREQYVVEVGNEPPLVEVTIAGNNTFFWDGRQVKYDVKVSDLEDDQLPEGIDQNKIEFDIAHYQSSDMAEALGHQSPVSDGLGLIESLDCKSCHKIDGSSIGPSYKAVSERYRNDRNASNYLAHKIINGGGGVWGEQVMSAHPDLSNDDAAKIVDYILGLGQNSDYPLSGTFQTTKEMGKYLFSASYEDAGKKPLKPIKEFGQVWLRHVELPADQFDDSYEIQARGGVINSAYNGSWVTYKDLDLTDIQAIKMNYFRSLEGNRISFRVGGPEGSEIGSASPGASDGPGSVIFDITPTNRKVDLCVFFENPDQKDRLVFIRNFEFIPKPDAL